MRQGLLDEFLFGRDLDNLSADSLSSDVDALVKELSHPQKDGKTCRVGPTAVAVEDSPVSADLERRPEALDQRPTSRSNKDGDAIGLDWRALEEALSEDENAAAAAAAAAAVGEESDQAAEAVPIGDGETERRHGSGGARGSAGAGAARGLLLVAGAEHDAMEEAEAPAGLATTLMLHQRMALRWMRRREEAGRVDTLFWIPPADPAAASSSSSSSNLTAHATVASSSSNLAALATTADAIAHAASDAPAAGAAARDRFEAAASASSAGTRAAAAVADPVDVAVEAAPVAGDDAPAAAPAGEVEAPPAECYRHALTGELRPRARPPLEARGGILADDMGLGKTLVVIALAASDPRRRRAGAAGGLEDQLAGLSLRELYSACVQAPAPLPGAEEEGEWGEGAGGLAEEGGGAEGAGAREAEAGDGEVELGPTGPTLIVCPLSVMYNWQVL
jgi:hypothetical protein